MQEVRSSILLGSTISTILPVGTVQLIWRGSAARQVVPPRNPVLSFSFPLFHQPGGSLEEVPTTTRTNPRIAFARRKLTRLHRNSTTEWLRLTWEENGEVRELDTTPGPHVLDRHGQFTRTRRMLEDDRANIVLANGTLTEVRADRFLYSAETGHQFERAVAYIDIGDGTAAKPAELDFWQTCNIEVEDLHTYVAAGVFQYGRGGRKTGLTKSGDNNSASGSLATCRLWSTLSVTR